MAEKNLMVVIGAKTEGLTKGMDELTKNLEKVGKQATKMGKDLSKKVTAPIVALGTLAIKSSVDFESAFAGVRKTVDATEEEFALLSQGIRDMAGEIPTAATEIAGVAEAAGQLGIQTENILGFTRVMSDLGVATNMSGEQAATALARLANITQMSQDEFDKLGSTIVALGNNLATTESEIVDMSLRLAGAGKQVGMTEAEILALAGSLSSVGIAADAGGSAFSKVMIEMQLAAEVGGESLDNFADVAGMSSAQFAHAFQEDAAGALIAFISGLQTAENRGMSAVKVLNDMGVSEVRMRDALLRAAGAGDLFTESIELGTRAWEENTALTEEAEQRYGTTASQLQILKNNINDVAIQFGDILVPILMKVVEKVQAFVDWLDNLSPAAKNTVVVIGLLAAAVGPVILAVGKVITVVTTLLPIIKGIGVVIGALVTGAGAPFIVLIAGIAAVIAAVVLFGDDFIAAIAKAVEWVSERIQAFADFWGGIFEWIRDHTVGVFEGMWEIIKKVINWIIGGINKMIAALNAISIDIPDWVPGLGGSSFGFNLKEIPLLADGGLINQPGLAVVGERGPEMVHLPQGAVVEPLAQDRVREKQPIQLTNIFHTNRELDEREVSRRTELSMRRLELEYARRF